MENRAASPSAVSRVDDAIEAAPFKVVEPGAFAAAAETAAETNARRDQVRDALDRDLQAAQYAADRAFRQYDAMDPENRLVATKLETRWNRTLARVREIDDRIAQYEAALPQKAGSRSIDPAALAGDLGKVWSTPTRMPPSKSALSAPSSKR